jgi:hypothetical protein
VIYDIGGTLEVAHISLAEGNAISISGDSTDDGGAWSQAKEFIVEVKDSLDNLAVVSMKAVTDSTNLYLLVKWRDPTRDVMPDHWLYNDSSGGHIRTSNLPLRGGQDFFMAMFSDGTNGNINADCWQMCHYRDPGPESVMRNDGPGMVDAWIWQSGKTDPVRTLEDMYYPPSDTFNYDQTAQIVPVWQENVQVNIPEIRWMHEDSPDYQGEFLFRSEMIEWQPFFYDEDSVRVLWPYGATVPGYALADSVIYYADESLWEIEAKGQYDEVEGYWVLEIKRRLDTGFMDDIQFILGQKIHASVAVKNSPGANSPDPHLGSEPFEIQF